MPILREGNAQVKSSTIPLMASWFGPDGKIVPRSTAQARADVCLACPMRGPTPPMLGLAADSIRQLLSLKAGMKLRVRGEKALGVCLACNCVNRLKVWMEADKIRREMNDDEFARLDPSCWIRKECT